MNRKELTYCLSVATKMEWMHKPVMLVLKTIQDMAVALQCETMAIKGYCKDTESTLKELSEYNKSELFKIKRECRKIRLDWGE